MIRYANGRSNAALLMKPKDATNINWQCHSSFFSYSNCFMKMAVVMMNEFPMPCQSFFSMKTANKAAENPVLSNGTEYLEIIEAAGVNPDDYPILSGINQHKIWHLVDAIVRRRCGKRIAQTRQTDHNFDGWCFLDHRFELGQRLRKMSLNRWLIASAAFHKKYDPLVQ